MGNIERQHHWEKIYASKPLTETSWYQLVPETSLSILKQFDIPFNAKIIDIGGGDSLFVDHLLDLGYQDITVLDISETAIRRAKQRLGERAHKVKWIVSDVSDFKPTEKYDFWHDRATFHFLTHEREIEHYIRIVTDYITSGGILVLATFSESGPKKCSGIDIKQYSDTSMTQLLENYFEKIKCIPVDHQTPSGTIQQFIFCSFRKP